MRGAAATVALYGVAVLLWVVIIGSVVIGMGGAEPVKNGGTTQEWNCPSYDRGACYTR